GFDVGNRRQHHHRRRFSSRNISADFYFRNRDSGRSHDRRSRLRRVEKDTESLSRGCGARILHRRGLGADSCPGQRSANGGGQQSNHHCDWEEIMTFEKTDSRINLSTPERCISGSAGIGLVLFGLKGLLGSNWRGRRKLQTPSIFEIIAAVTGGYLIQRGITGHSYEYRALGINTASLDKTGKAPQA